MKWCERMKGRLDSFRNRRHAPRIEIARREDGPAIFRLIRANEWAGLEALCWEDCCGSWLVARIGPTTVGCVQVLVGKPLGRAEHMGLSEYLTKRQRAEVAGMLIEQACVILKLAGCGAVMTLVPVELESYRHVLERRGGVAVSMENVMMVKRLV